MGPMRTPHAPRKPHAIHTALGGVLLAIACLTVAVRAHAQSPTKGPPVRLQLKWFHSFQFAGYYAAQDQGYYRNAGIDVDLLEGAPDREPISTVLKGDAEFGVQGPALLLARLQGKPVVAVATILQHSPYVLITRADSGIVTPSQLAGKRMMASEGHSEFEIDAMLVREGVPFNTITIEPYTWRLQDLIEGKTDAIPAYISDEPFRLEQQGVKVNVIAAVNYGIDFYGDTLFTTESFARKNTELVQRFRAATLRGWEYALGHQDELVDLILALPTKTTEPHNSAALHYEARTMERLILPDVIEIGHQNRGRWRRMADTAFALQLAPTAALPEEFVFDPTPAPPLRSWPYLAVVGIVGLVALLIFLIILAWNWQLRATVRRRTAEIAEQATALAAEIEARRATEESQARLASIAEATSDYIAISDTKGKLLFLNRAGRRLADIAPEAPAEELDIRRMLPPREFERLVHEVMPLVRETSGWAGQSALLTTDGREVPILQVILAHRGANQELKYFSTIARDITALKRTEMTLRERERQLLTLMQNLPGMAYRCLNDQDWTMKFVSDGALELTGYNADELINNREVAYASLIVDEDRETVWNSVQAALEDHQPYQLLYRIRTRNGDLRWVWEHGRGVFTRRTARLVALEGFIADITQRRSAELTAGQMRTYLQNVIDSMPSILVGVDLNGRVTQWSQEAERFTNCPAAAALGELVSSVLPFLQGDLSQLEDAIATRAPKKSTFTSLQGADAGHHYDIMIYPLTGEDIDGAVIRVDDVTQRTRLEAMMAQTEKMMLIGGLAAGMAHEINNPLGGILQACTNILRRVAPERDDNLAAAQAAGVELAQVREYLEQRRIFEFIGNIQEASQRASKIVADMLAFSRSADTHKTKVSAIDVLETTMRLAANDVEMQLPAGQRVALSLECPEDLGMVHCDSAKIQQVLLNLIRNAVQALGAGTADHEPRIILRAARHKIALQIEVEDNGPGMDEETQRHAFEPFFTTKGVGVGTGLGLSVSYFLIVDQHKGSIHVESTPGHGARFVIRLPVDTA